MTVTSTILNNISAEDLYSLFKILEIQIAELKQNFELKTPTEYLTRTEAAQLLKCDLSTIHNWTKKGKLKPYGIGNRVYYKRSEIELVLIPLK
ncbi:MAG: helix-turn-helix domain-containing protein [Bacteroidota bacterium]